jgi:ABC-type dipeptide/oligopeptide/nickel transport system ATPase component
MAAKVKEQNLAVFGESGSGKTVLLSSFYGSSQEPSFLAESLYKVLADDTGGPAVAVAAASPFASASARVP